MLLELRLRVYEAQMERKDDPFNQTEFDRILLQNVLKTQLAMAKVLGVSTLAKMYPINRNLIIIRKLFMK
jgi:hypothetical protein